MGADICPQGSNLIATGLSLHSQVVASTPLIKRVDQGQNNLTRISEHRH